MAAVSSHALMNWGAENGWNWAHQTIFVSSQPLELWINADTLFAPAWHCWHGTVSSGKPMLVSPLPKTLCIPPLTELGFETQNVSDGFMSPRPVGSQQQDFSC